MRNEEIAKSPNKKSNRHHQNETEKWKKQQKLLFINEKMENIQKKYKETFFLLLISFYKI